MAAVGTLPRAGVVGSHMAIPDTGASRRSWCQNDTWRTPTEVARSHIARGDPVTFDPSRVVRQCPKSPLRAGPRSGSRRSLMATDIATSIAGDAQTSPSGRPWTLDDIREHVRSANVRFLFAQFVDLHGKPSAKLVPTTHLDDLFEDGAGFA